MWGSTNQSSNQIAADGTIGLASMFNSSFVVVVVGGGGGGGGGYKLKANICK